MNTGFEITVDDVATVLDRMGLVEDAEEYFEQIDHDRVEAAALYGNDMDEQTAYAYDEIEIQINEIKGNV